VPLPKKGQEELVGFVLVVVIVAVAGLIIMGLFLRIDGGKQTMKSADIAQFLDSASLVTTKCHISSPLFPASIGELAVACSSNKGERCLEGTNACSVLNISMQEIIKSSWTIGTNSTIRGYEFQIIMTSNKTTSLTSTPVLLIQEGACTKDYRLGEHIQPGARRGTSLVTTLKLCVDA